ncbi:MAG TPA: (5-formylfuran-3-yl)methyl phosphate synthase [Burkholderiales bacterium]|nr:(5-formylfuran-3-yl)methyl phosphate synthase [Burkholderiales bacterium]
MTRLLVSVKSLDEARMALECGADIIDFKDPANGALGVLPSDTVRETAQWINRRCPVSATLGDLPMEPATLVQAVRKAAAGVDFVKIGFFPHGDSRICIHALARQARRVGLVAVLFADCNPDFSLLEALAQAGFAGVMLDTADKTQGGLRRHWDDAGLNNFVKRAQRLGLIAGLAGSLRLEDVSDLIQLGPDYLGFRGALCARTQRNSGLQASRVSALRHAIPRLSAESSMAVGG